MAVLVDLIRPMRDQATGSGKETFEIDRGQVVPGRKRDDCLFLVARRHQICGYQADVELARNLGLLTSGLLFAKKVT